MRLRVQGFLAIAVFQTQVFNLARQVVKTFGAQKLIVRRMANPALQPDEFMQMGMGFPRGKIEIPAAAFGVKPQLHGDGFQQGGFARAILTDKKSDRGMKFQSLQMLNGWDIERILRLYS